MLDYLVSSMDEVTRTHPNIGIVLLADFDQLPDSQLRSYPLQQLVDTATRGTSILDKIYTNISSWFVTPESLPPVSRSDDETILLKPAADPPRPSKSVKVIYCRLVFPNRKALLYNQLVHYNWTPLFRMNSCQEMVDSFYSVVTYWLDHFMPIVLTSVSNLNKPWVTESFLDLIKQRQRARMASQRELYHKLRNELTAWLLPCESFTMKRRSRAYGKPTRIHGGEKLSSFFAMISQTPFATYNGNTHT